MKKRSHKYLCSSDLFSLDLEVLKSSLHLEKKGFRNKLEKKRESVSVSYYDLLSCNFQAYPIQEIAGNIWKKMELIVSFICCLNSSIFPNLLNNWCIFSSCSRKEGIQITQCNYLQQPVSKLHQSLIQRIHRWPGLSSPCFTC